MIECELCGGYFHADDIERCPNCGIELCPSCFKEHVVVCLNDDDNFDDEMSDMRLPAECPQCGEKLELDIEFATNGNGHTKRLYCVNEECDYELDITNKFSDEEE